MKKQEKQQEFYEKYGENEKEILPWRFRTSLQMISLKRIYPKTERGREH